MNVEEAIAACNAIEDDSAYWEDDRGCECEIDWNCGLCEAAGKVGTFLETRYQDLDAEEAHAYGRPWDA